MGAFTDTTRVATASSTSPGAGTTLAAITIPSAGLYDVTLKILLTGTAETALRNLILREAGAPLYNDLPSVPASGEWLTLNFKRVEINTDGASLNVITNAAAVVGAIYNIVLMADRVG